MPNYVSETQLRRRQKLKTTDTNASAGANSSDAPQDDLQLTKFSGVLNSLKKGAFSMRTQSTQVMGAVQSGTYEVDPLQVSRNIVAESIASR